MSPDLAKALVKFRGLTKTIGYDSQNPHFKAKFASLAAVQRTVDPWLHQCGLTVIQFPINPEGGQGVGVRTILIHESGDSIESDFFLPTMKNDPQSAGSSVTYARRYALSGALALVTDEDEDGELAMDRRHAIEKPNKPKPSRKRAAAQPSMGKDHRDQLKSAVDARIEESQPCADTQSSVLALIAKALGHSSPIQIKDEEFDKAIAMARGWAPGAAA